MNKLYKRLGAVFLALAVFTVNVPTNTVHARDFIQMTSSGDSSSDTSSESSSEGSSSEESSSDTSSDSGSSSKPVEPVLSFTFDSYSTGASSTVFNDEDIKITVKNSTEDENFLYEYEWYLEDENGNSEMYSKPGPTMTFTANDVKLSDKIYVMAKYKDNELTNPEDSFEYGPKYVGITLMTRPQIEAEIKPSPYRFEVGTQNINTIYLEPTGGYDFTKTAVEWKMDAGLQGGNQLEDSSQNKFSYEPPSSITESVGTYEIYANILYDHDDDGKADAFISKTDPLTVEIYDDSGIGLKIEGETNYAYNATGSAELVATLSGITEADLTDGKYIWTVDGVDPSPNSDTNKLTINLSALKSTQTYEVKVGYIDGDGNAQTLTATITLVKGDTPSADEDEDDNSDDDSNDDSDDNNGSDGSYYPTISTDLSVASKVYVQHRAASPLEIEVDPRLDGTISYKWYVNKAYSTVGGTLLNYEYGIPTNSSTIKPSVTPSTDTVGTFYYYCEVTNHFGDFTKTTRSNIATIQVIPDTTAATKYTVSSDGKLEVADYSKVVVDWSTFDEFIDDGGEVLYVTGAYIQNLRVPAVYSTNAYQVVVKDTGYNLEYTWKIKDGSRVSGYLDLALATTTSLSGVEKGNSALNYDARYSQIIQFKHEGALTTNDKGITLEMPTTVKDGDGHLNKINTDSTIDFNTYVKGSIDNGILTVNMKECSDWVVSALKLAELTDYDNTNGTGAVTGFLNIPTFVGFEISEFKNVVVGQMIYLDKINMDTIENNRFTGWYYDTAFLEPVSATDVKNGMLVTREIATNGLYPKYEKSNSYVPAINTPVPSTGFTGNETIKLNALF